MQEKVNKIYNGNNLDVLKNFQDNSCDALITDYPYALSDVDPLKMIKDGVNNKAGFMGKSWDCMPTVDMLKEFYRVLKTGGFCVTTFTPRQDLQTVLLYRLMEAGFDVSFSPLYFAYCTGFPKASNYNKVMSKRGLKNEAIYCDGLYSLSAKPALEPIIIAQKPHGKAKYKQALEWYYERKELLDKGIPEEDLSLYTKNSSGGVFFDNTRIPTSDKLELKETGGAGMYDNIDGKWYRKDTGAEAKHYQPSTKDWSNTQGRFPANLLCGFPISKEELRSEYPEATEEELDKMVSMIENPIDVGREFKSGGNEKQYNRENSINKDKFLGKLFNKSHKQSIMPGSSGDLSRYFSLTAWSKKHFPNLHNIAEKTLQLQDDVEKTGDLLFVAKPSKSEKNAGLDGFEKKYKDGYERNCITQHMEGRNGSGKPASPQQNTHPTTKPIVVYNYLITLFSKEGDIILDPFCGSGVTPIACVLTNRRYIGIEMEAEYCKIAEARVEYYKQQKEGVKNASASKKNVSASISTKEKNQESLF